MLGFSLLKYWAYVQYVETREYHTSRAVRYINVHERYATFSFTTLSILLTRTRTLDFSVRWKQCESAQIDSGSIYFQTVTQVPSTDPSEINRPFFGVGTVRISFPIRYRYHSCLSAQH